MTDYPQSTFFALSVADGVAHLELDNAGKANAMAPAFWTELPQVMAALDADPGVRAVVLSGRGKHFCAGIDLAAFQGIMGVLQAEPGRAALALRAEIRRLQDALTALETARVPVIAAVHGACIGGGIDLIAACDIRIAAQDSRFAIAEIDLGMTADVGTLQRLPKMMPLGVLRELAYTGRDFTADEARGWGIVNAVHADRDATIAAALDMARTIAAKSPLAVAGTKAAITYARDHAVPDALDQIATWNAGMLRPEDLMRAMQARAKKQQADFADLLKGL
jgi:enoyl-CoA hydratase